MRRHLLPWNYCDRIGTLGQVRRLWALTGGSGSSSRPWQLGLHLDQALGMGTELMSPGPLGQRQPFQSGPGL